MPIRYEQYEFIRSRRDRRVLLLSFNRPDRLNAMTGKFHAELATIFADVAQDLDTDAVVLTGEGTAFSAGGDLDWIRDQTSAELDRSFFEARKIVIDLLELPQPIVAAVNGHAIGLGATLALFCDFAYAALGARIGDPHVVLGLLPGDGPTVAWPWLVGMMRAKRYLMTGDPISAGDAAEIGLITAAVPPDDLLPTAIKTAHRLAALPPLAVRGTKAVLNKLLRDTANLMLDASLAIERRCKDSDDHRRALDAYMEAQNARRSTTANRNR